MAVTFEDVIASILLMRVDGQYHFVIVSDESGQVSNHRIRVLAFRLQNDAGIGPDYLLELNITLPLEECEQPDTCIIVAPRICWGRKRWEVFRQFIIRLVNYQSAEEVDKEVQQSLALPLNRLHNSLNMYFPYLMDNKVVRQKVLAHFAPADVVRLDRVSVSLRNSLLSDTVDKGFWKPHYERLFGKATSEQPFTYRQEFFIKKKRQRQAATSLMSLRARQMPVIS
uniref:DUF3800 domain-containing protein n=1 Tax=Globodera pallida TaxID=36090 RepID=A0A183CK64_GLOPA